MIVGSKKHREDALKELEKRPNEDRRLNYGICSQRKMPWDYVSELGCRQSIDNTVRYRMRKLTSKINDIIMLGDSPIMGADVLSSNKNL